MIRRLSSGNVVEGAFPDNRVPLAPILLRIVWDIRTLLGASRGVFTGRGAVWAGGGCGLSGKMWPSAVSRATRGAGGGAVRSGIRGLRTAGAPPEKPRGWGRGRAEVRASPPRFPGEAVRRPVGPIAAALRSKMGARGTSLTPLADLTIVRGGNVQAWRSEQGCRPERSGPWTTSVLPILACWRIERWSWVVSVAGRGLRVKRKGAFPAQRPVFVCLFACGMSPSDSGSGGLGRVLLCGSACERSPLHSGSGQWVGRGVRTHSCGSRSDPSSLSPCVRNPSHLPRSVERT